MTLQQLAIGLVVGGLSLALLAASSERLSPKATPRDYEATFKGHVEERDGVRTQCVGFEHFIVCTDGAAVRVYSKSGTLLGVVP